MRWYDSCGQRTPVFSGAARPRADMIDARRVTSEALDRPSDMLERSTGLPVAGAGHLGNGHPGEKGGRRATGRQATLGSRGAVREGDEATGVREPHERYRTLGRVPKGEWERLPAPSTQAREQQDTLTSPSLCTAPRRILREGQAGAQLHRRSARKHCFRRGAIRDTERRRTFKGKNVEGSAKKSTEREKRAQPN